MKACIPLSPPSNSLDIHSFKWKYHSKHFFILSEAGKPIYTRYGDESKLASFTGVLASLTNFLIYRKDVIKSIHTKDCVIVFRQHGPYWLVAVSHTTEAISTLELQLDHLHSHIIFFLTRLAHTYLERKPQYDIRIMLGGLDKFVDNSIHWINRDPAFLLQCAESLPLPSVARNNIGNILLEKRPHNLL